MPDRTLLVAAGVAFVLLIAAANVFGGKQNISVTEKEIRELRQKVAFLEAQMGVSPGKPVSAAVTTTFSRTGDAFQRPAAAATTPTNLQASASTSAPVPAPAVAMASVVEAPASAMRTPMETRTRPPPGKKVVPMASWWSNKDVRTANGEWCPEPPPYAAPKLPLPAITPGTDMPALTKELVMKHASKDNMLIATYVNYNRLDFAYTFVKHLIALGNPHYLVGALDEKALRGLQSNGIQSFLIDSGLTTNDYGWGTQAFRQLGLHKVQLVYNLAKTGVDALVVDADAFILRDPFPYIRNLPTAEVLTSSDHLVATNGYGDSGLESAAGFYSAFNIGYIFIKASAIEFVAKWRDTCYRRKNDWDQVLFSQVLNSGSSGRSVDKNRLRAMYQKSDGTHVMAGVLPVSLFASGHTHFVSRMAHLMHQHPYMVHTTFQYGGAQGKRHRLRDAMMWEDNASYYSEGNFLVYEPDLPYDLVYTKGGKVQADGTQEFSQRTSVEQHFALVHHQLVQIRNGFALAKATGRTLILPRLVCGLDRWWAPHSGIIPGSAARLPLLECPADHVIDLERIGKPERVLRESTFLCNPRTPTAVLASTRIVDPSLGSPKILPDGSNKAVALAEGKALVEKLKMEHAATKVLRLSKLPPDYRAVLEGRELDSFEETMRGYAGIWCCNRPPGGRGAGHIWYDFLWDVLPHVDRHRRKWDASNPWFPKMGP